MGEATLSETRLVIRESARDWSGTIHASDADRAVAALSADPVTLEELEAAIGRFARPIRGCRLFANLSQGLCDEPYDAGLVVIDLVARLIVVDSTYSSPATRGVVPYHDGRCATDLWVKYHLADDWLISSAAEGWRCRAKDRRRERAGKPFRDVRGVFYGRPMLEFIGAKPSPGAKRSTPRLAQRSDHAQQRLADQERYASPFYDTLKQIHAAWLLTPREDLDGACPREIAPRAA